MGRHSAIHSRPDYWQLPTWATHIFDRLERLETMTSAVDSAWSDLDAEISAIVALAQQAAASPADPNLSAEIEQRATTIRNALSAAQGASSTAPAASDPAASAPAATDPSAPAPGAPTDPTTGDTTTPVTPTGDDAPAPGTTPAADVPATPADGTTPAQ